LGGIKQKNHTKSPVSKAIILVEYWAVNGLFFTYLIGN